MMFTEVANMSLRATRIEMPASTREQVVTLLNQRVAEVTDVWMQIKLAHWNVRGPHFQAYHTLFDTLADHLLEAQDALAERAATLGGEAGMPLGQMAQMANGPTWPMGVRQDRQVIILVADRLSHIANRIRQDIDETAAWGDAGTADLLTEISRQLDHDLWLVEAHGEA